MAETQAAKIDRLTAENESLKAQLASVAAGGPAVGRAAVPQHTFQLSEGDRQLLESQGWINWQGVVLTKEDVEKRLKETGQEVAGGIADAPEGAPQPPVSTGVRSAIRGVDFVYPSVEPGKIDPAVAGTPGINGPAADSTEGADVQVHENSPAPAVDPRLASESTSTEGTGV